ncbi:hypothetical protein Cni_G22188 [Canna indica]|uniref:SWIM-type domain-containing protein n=1 Tax=Canna indica TaxID=4628 RepID=A0AAQ3KUN4_9LILI|nr:hypothetical protein Cni_G22188 [Canna indica]
MTIDSVAEIIMLEPIPEEVLESQNNISSISTQYGSNVVDNGDRIHFPIDLNMSLIFEDDTYDIVEEELTNERIREEVEQVENLPFDMFTSYDVVGCTITLDQYMYEAHHTEVGYCSDEENETIVNNDDLDSLLDFTPEDQIRDINNDLNEDMYDNRASSASGDEEDDTIITARIHFIVIKHKIANCIFIREEFRRALRSYCIKRNFELRHIESRLRYIKVGCKHGDCPWMLSASGRGRFTIANFLNKHTCTVSRLNLDHKDCSAKFVANHIKDHLVRNQKYKPAMIVIEIQKAFGVRISYKKAYNALQLALISVRGDFDKCYKDLPAYLRELKIHDNEIMVKLLRCSVSSRFLRVFWAFGACLRRFREYLRPIICIDATHLRGKYPGALMIATIVDAESRLFSVAFGVCEIEKRDTWEWFLDEFAHCIPSFRDLSIMSDRNSGILAVVRKVFPKASHGYCMVHLAKNLIHDVKINVGCPLFWYAARATTEHNFNKCMQKLLDIHEPSYQWVTRLEKERWATLFFLGRRYDIITTNAVESMNSLFREVREMPITTLIELTRGKVAEWFYKSRKVSLKLSGILTKRAEDILIENRSKCRWYSVHPHTDHCYQVHTSNQIVIVDLPNRSCSCNKFQIFGIPCSHVMAVIGYRSLDPYPFCEYYFTVETYKKIYEDKIFPTRSKQYWRRESFDP